MEQLQKAYEDTSGRLTLISKADIKSLEISPFELIETIEHAFKGKARGQVELPFKPTIHPRPDCFLRALPGYLQNPDVAGLKWVSAYPSNRKVGRPIVGGLIILNNPETGLPLAILEGSLITAWRTAAVSAVAAKILARDGASILSICGAGVQGSVHLSFLSFVLPSLKEVRIYDPDSEVLNLFLDKQASQNPQLFLKGVSSPQEGVRGADVVVTAAPMFEKQMEILVAEDLAKGVLCLPLDLDSYFAPSSFESFNLIFSDDPDQLFELQKQGRFKHLHHIDADYGQLLIHQSPGRLNDGQCIMAISVGIALGDIAIAYLIYSKAIAKGRGMSLEL